MRDFNKPRPNTVAIVIHCTQTEPGEYVTIEGLDRPLRNAGFIGTWGKTPYHRLIRRSGEVIATRPLKAFGMATNGMNDIVVSVALVGGADSEGNPEDNFTDAQRSALKTTIRKIREEYPDQLIEVFGHDALSSDKSSPAFDWTYL